MIKMINEQQVFEDWSPIIEEKTGIKDRSKVEWLSKYCHYHALNESAGAYDTLAMMNGQGQPLAPTRASAGSGDKFPSLLPLAIQVAAKTVGFDIVPVIPMPGPTGVITYLDYVYAGGTIAGSITPIVIKVNVNPASPPTTFVNGTVYFATSGHTTPASGDSGVLLTFIGLSRIDGYEIFKVGNVYTYSGSWTLSSTVSIANVFDGSALVCASNAGAVPSGTLTAVSATVTNTASLVEALTDHIAGFTGAGDTNTANYEGPYATNDFVGPMDREVGETTYYQSMGLTTFTNFVEAKTYQVAASVTTEQIQDLNKQFGIDVVSMIENALVNEVSQAINKHILGQAFALGVTNATQFANTEGQSLNLDLSAIANFSFTGAFENFATAQRRIFSRILAAANVVANRGRRGPANFVVTNPQLATSIQDVSQFVAVPFANTASQNNGSLYPVGSLAGMTVYVDQNMKWNDTRILIGRKGADDEPGLKFMPYMMAESIQTISEGTMSPKIAVKSRYALIQAGFYPETMYYTVNVTVPGNGIV